MTLPMPRHELAVGFEHHDHSYKRTKKLKGGQPNVNGTLYLGITKHQSPCTHNLDHHLTLWCLLLNRRWMLWCAWQGSRRKPPLSGEGQCYRVRVPSRLRSSFCGVSARRWGVVTTSFNSTFDTFLFIVALCPAGTAFSSRWRSGSWTSKRSIPLDTSSTTSPCLDVTTSIRP